MKEFKILNEKLNQLKRKLYLNENRTFDPFEYAHTGITYKTIQKATNKLVKISDYEEIMKDYDAIFSDALDSATFEDVVTVVLNELLENNYQALRIFERGSEDFLDDSSFKFFLKEFSKTFKKLVDEGVRNGEFVDVHKTHLEIVKGTFDIKPSEREFEFLRDLFISISENT